MCVPYASDSGGMPVPGLGGVAGTNANLFSGIAGSMASAMPGLTGSDPGIIPTAAPTAGLSSPLVPAVAGAPAAATVPTPPAKPETAAVPGTEPVAGTPAPVVPGNPVAKPPWKGWGFDPLPQTSAMPGPLGGRGVTSQGHDTLSPLADAIIARRAARTVPTPPASPGETAAVPGTEAVSSTGPTAGATVLSGGSANTGLPPAAPSYTGGKLPDTNVMASYIRQRASELGIDPNVAEAVARSEGLGASTWQSNLSGGGGPGNLEASFGPFQLNDKYMGADFTRATGLRASDPSTWKEQVDFVLGRVPTTGWSPFHGAARVGIGSRQGLPATVRGAGPSDTAANGAPLIAFGDPAIATTKAEAVNETTDPEALAAAGVTPPSPAARQGRGIQYANKGSTRSQPLQPKLESILDQATAPEGVTTRVISGGQPSTGGPSVRTGSHRHDNGGAGDVQFIKDGRVLDMTVPADLEIIKRIIGRAHGLGATGIGASPSYMGSRTFHIGFGTPAVWGAGGQGKNAPGWLVAATTGPVAPGSDGGGTIVASDTSNATSPSPRSSGIASILPGLGGGGGGGGGRGVPASGMDKRIQEFLIADAERRRKERDRLPAIGNLAVDTNRLVPERGNWDVASLASIIGAS